MSASYPSQSTFNKGELSPLLGSRADIDFWRQALYRCRNFNVLTHGGIRRRSGTRFVAEVANHNEPARLLPFVFSEEQSYVLCLNGGVMRFLAERGEVVSGGSPYQIGHPWAAGELQRLSYAQFNDTAYFAHKGYQPRRLTRGGETSWNIALQDFRDGPFLDGSPAVAAFTPSSRADIRDMPGVVTSNIPPESPGWAAQRAFDGDKGTFTGFTDFPIELTYSIGGGLSAVANSYWVTGAPNGSDSPSSFQLQGSNGGAWVTLDSRDGETGWSGSETRFFDFINETAYSAYRLRLTGTNYTGTDGRYVKVSEIGINSSGHAITLTASSTAGINGGAGFTANDIGRSIRLQGSDSRWRWGRIFARHSATSVDIQIFGPSLPDLSPIPNWRLGAFSQASGWPGCVALYNERLMWGRTNAQPVTVWGSKQGRFDDYGISDPVRVTDGLNITLLSSSMNEVLWISDDEDLITGSSAQIRSVGPSDLTQSFSATNITQRKGPTNGAAAIQPLSVGGVVLYTGIGGTKIRELVLGEQNRYVAPELSLLGEHFFKAGIKGWAFSEKPDPTIWAVINDGSVVSLTYDREQRVIGFARHDFGGAVENVAVIPGVQDGFDDVYFVVHRTINGAFRRYIEVLERPFDGDTDTLNDAYHVDCGVTYSGAPVTTIAGIAHLEGRNVVALADGGVVRGLTVSGGSVTLPYAASKIHIGLPFKSEAVSLPVSGPGVDGTLFGRRKNVIGASVDVLSSGSLKAGAFRENGNFPIAEHLMKKGDKLFGSAIDPQTGFVPCEIEGSWAEGNGQVVMETDEPLPLLIRSLVLQLESEP